MSHPDESWRALRDSGFLVGTGRRPRTYDHADQVRRAIVWAYRNAESFGGDPARFYIGGHSSGAHLAGVALTTDWQKDFGLPRDFIRGGLCISGMYELKPVPLSSRNSYVKMDDSTEEASARSGISIN